MNLKEWSAVFIKQRDLMKREIAELEEIPDGFIAHLKTRGERTIYVKKDLDRVPQAHTICTLNTAKNVDFVARHWNEFVNKDPLLVFCNPRTNEKWLLKPHLHHKIADDNSLAEGLKSMHESISKP